MDGEASANNRKSKLIFFYEWVISGEWEGDLELFLFEIYFINIFIHYNKKGTEKNSNNKTVYKGTLEVPNLSEEHNPKDVDVKLNDF